MKSRDAMIFAMEVHVEDKYGDRPYSSHLAQVAGLYAATHPYDEVGVAVSWLHDVTEDHHVPHKVLVERFGDEVADGVMWLTNVPPSAGTNRANRSVADRLRMTQAPGWVQDVKVCDIIVNTMSRKGPLEFDVRYRQEKREMLDVLTLADPTLIEIARSQLEW